MQIRGMKSPQIRLCGISLRTGVGRFTPNRALTGPKNLAAQRNPSCTPGDASFVAGRFVYSSSPAPMRTDQRSLT